MRRARTRGGGRSNEHDPETGPAHHARKAISWSRMEARPLLTIVCASLVCGAVAIAASERAPAPFAELIGAAHSDRVRIGDTLLDVAERNRLGFERVARLNPQLDVWIPEPGSLVRLPTSHILPDAPREGLVVNLPELQLYDFGASPEAPEVFALAIGDEMDPSLVGEFRVGKKRVDPVWHVPASIRTEKPELPAEVSPGPENPLGRHWLTIGRTSYGIHGTNNRWSIGREATHGCLRLYNDDVARLFARTKEGTRIRLVYQTVKLGRRGGIVYVEAHPDRYGRDPKRVDDAIARLVEAGVDDEAALARVRETIEAARGEPVPVAVLPDDPPPSTSRRTS